MEISGKVKSADRHLRAGPLPGKKWHCSPLCANVPLFFVPDSVAVILGLIFHSQQQLQESGIKSFCPANKYIYIYVYINKILLSALLVAASPYVLLHVTLGDIKVFTLK